MNDSAIPPGVGFAPAWALALGQLGRGSVLAATLLFLVAFALSLREPSARWGRLAFLGGAVAFVATLAALGTLFLKDQFEFAYVFNHSDFRNPSTYKFAAIWTAQEGSFLLWGVTSAVFGSWAILRGGAFARHATAVLGLCLAAIAAILHFGSPFELLKDVAHDGHILLPPNGAGMTPALQNYWVVIHPPTIFSGFGLLAVPFGFALAGLLRRDLAGWIAPARPFVLWGVAVLGLGISMGGLWAYETQGWGGFWAWDPVENVSLVPWIFLVALSHAMIVQARTGVGRVATLALGLLPFALFVYGTFLTRSGLLDKVSVHSFASMEGNGLVVLRTMLIALAVVVVAAIARGVAVARAVAPEKAPAKSDSGFDRSEGYNAGLLLLSLIGAVVALGMSWPVVSALVQKSEGQKVEEGLYQLALLPFFLPLLALMAITPFASWRKEGWSVVLRKTTNALAASLFLTGVALLAAKLVPGFSIPLDTAKTVDGPLHTKVNGLAAVAVVVWLCVFVGCANVMRALQSAKRSKMALGGYVAHLGIATLFGGLIISHGLERKERIFVREGAPGEGLGYKIEFKEFTGKDIYDRDGKVRLNVTEPSGRSFPAAPTLYYYDGPEGKPTANVWPHIERSFTHDVYIALREPITEVFAAPLTLKPGETKEQEGLKLTYRQMTMSGQPGQAGTKFGAIVDVEYKGDVVRAHPELEITPEGLRPSLAPAGKDFKLAMTSMDAGSRSVSLQALLSPPIYPIELFEKPLTSLVWIGTLIFTVGGAMSAFARRPKRPTDAPKGGSPVVPPLDEREEFDLPSLPKEPVVEREPVLSPYQTGSGGAGATLPAS